MPVSHWHRSLRVCYWEEICDRDCLRLSTCYLEIKKGYMEQNATKKQFYHVFGKNQIRNGIVSAMGRKFFAYFHCSCYTVKWIIGTPHL